MINDPASRYLRYILLMCLIFILLLAPLPCFPVFSISPALADGEGWYLQGNPVITKDKDQDNPPCYINRKITVTNGQIAGQVTHSSECFKEGSGTYTGQFNWNQPPSYMKPGDNITFTGTAVGSHGVKTTTGMVKAGGKNIIDIMSWTPQSQTAVYAVPKGSNGNEMEIFAGAGSCGLTGGVLYKYKYQGAGTGTNNEPYTEVPKDPIYNDTIPEEPAPGPLTDKLPKISKKDVAYVIRYIANRPIYISADPSSVPPSERKWVKFIPGDVAIPVGTDWTIRTTATSEVAIQTVNNLFVRTEGMWIKLLAKQRSGMVGPSVKVKKEDLDNKNILPLLRRTVTVSSTSKDWAIQMVEGQPVLVIKDLPGQKNDESLTAAHPYTMDDVAQRLKQQDMYDSVVCNIFFSAKEKSSMKLRYRSGFKGTDIYDLETNLSLSEINGTDYVVEFRDTEESYMVIEGEISVTHKATGTKATLSAGKQITVTQSGLTKVTDFEIAAKKNIWDVNKAIESMTDETQANNMEDSNSSNQKIKIGPLSCFIATAAYGSETAKELDILRAFRDKVLLKNEQGKWFVDTYYQVSPPMAEFIAEHEELRTFVREVLLNPVVIILDKSQEVWNN